MVTESLEQRLDCENKILSQRRQFSGVVRNNSALRSFGVFEKDGNVARSSQSLRQLSRADQSVFVGPLVELEICDVARLQGSDQEKLHNFARGKAWMILACLFAVLIWGVGFMVVAGDWFLAWEAPKDPLTQLGAMIGVRHG